MSQAIVETLRLNHSRNQSHGLYPITLPYFTGLRALDVEIVTPVDLAGIDVVRSLEYLTIAQDNGGYLDEDKDIPDPILNFLEADGRRNVKSLFDSMPRLDIIEVMRMDNDYMRYVRGRVDAPEKVDCFDTHLHVEILRDTM